MLHALLLLTPLAAVAPAKEAADGSADPAFDLPMSGEVTATTAIVQYRVPPAPGSPGGNRNGTFQLGTTPALTWDRGADVRESGHIAVSEEIDWIARARFEGLTPGTRYWYRFVPNRTDLLDRGRVGTFRTPPGPGSDAGTRFCVAACINYSKFRGSDAIDRELHLKQNNTELAPPAPEEQQALGYPGLSAMADLDPDFVVLTGDTVYYDTPVDGRAETLPEMRAKWHEQFGLPRFRDLLARVPVFHMKDDHDFRKDDSDRSGDYFPSTELGIATFREQLPIVPPGPHMADPAKEKTYRTVRVNEHLQVWIVEGRDYRSPNDAPDGPGKTIWGEEQFEWLTTGLKESDAAFKILISPTPLVGPDDKRKTDNHTNFGGFRHERGRFFDFLADNGLLDGSNGRFFSVCGDRHWQYHAKHPSGVEEFSVGALDDTNSRPGRKAGDPASTDPDGNITQYYLMHRENRAPESGEAGMVETPPSGGFLYVELFEPGRGIAPAAPGAAERVRLDLILFDEAGRQQYAHTFVTPPPAEQP